MLPGTNLIFFENGTKEPYPARLAATINTEVVP